MTTFPAYASDFEIYPKDGEASEHLAPLLGGLNRVEFNLRVDDPAVNQGQMISDFDDALEKSLLVAGAHPFCLKLPRETPQDHDFAFNYGGRTVAVEIEKANREKILRDLLKCHMYLHAGADYAIIGLPRNYPHKLGVWNLYEFGVARLSECKTYGFGTADKLGRILLLGFTQFDKTTGQPFSVATRQIMRIQATANLSRD